MSLGYFHWFYYNIPLSQHLSYVLSLSNPND
nr:MAG TPA: hypothetical protein [Bacteriophage sp.]